MVNIYFILLFDSLWIVFGILFPITVECALLFNKHNFFFSLKTKEKMCGSRLRHLDFLCRNIDINCFCIFCMLSLNFWIKWFLSGHAVHVKECSSAGASVYLIPKFAELCLQHLEIHSSPNGNAHCLLTHGFDFRKCIWSKKNLFNLF